MQLLVVGATASQSVDLDLFPKLSLTKIFLKMVSTAFLLGARHFVRVLCPWPRNLTGRPTFTWKTGGPVFPPKRGLVARRASDRKNKCHAITIVTSSLNRDPWGVSEPATDHREADRRR